MTQTLYELAQPIADTLTMFDKKRTWSAAANHTGDGDIMAGWAYLESNDGYKLSLNNGSWANWNRSKDRITVGPATMRYADGQVFCTDSRRPQPVATVAAKRDPLSIARDIYRRIFPDVITWIDTTRAIIDKSNHRQQMQEDSIKHIKQHFKLTHNSHYKERVSGRGWTAMIAPGGTVSEIVLRAANLDADAAIKIIETFNKHKG